MPNPPNRLDRKSHRLRGRSYAAPGDYFVTICTHKKVCLFGRIVEKSERLNAAGRMVRREWERVPNDLPGVEALAFVVMPNHVHGILRVTPRAEADLGTVVGSFKSRTTVAYIRGVRERGWSPFDRQLWQRSYFDRVIRDEDEFLRAEQYIRMNPSRWWFDAVNPRGRPQGPPEQGPM